MKYELNGGKKFMKLITLIIAILAFILSAFNSYYQFVHKPYKIIITRLDFNQHGLYNIDNTFTSKLVFINAGKHNIIISKIFITLKTPYFSGERIIPWDRYLDGTIAKPFVLNSGEPIIKEIVFDYKDYSFVTDLCKDTLEDAIISTSVIVKVIGPEGKESDIGLGNIEINVKKGKITEASMKSVYQATFPK